MGYKRHVTFKFQSHLQPHLTHIFCILGLVFYGCASYQYEAAKELNTVDAYENFIMEYSQEKDDEIIQYVKSIKKLREQLLWDQALSINKMEGFENYLQSQRDGFRLHERDAQERFDHLLLERSFREQDGLKHFKDHCKVCADTHLRELIDHNCKAQLKDLKAKLATPPSSQWRLDITDECVKSSKKDISLKSKVVISFYDKDDKVHHHFEEICSTYGPPKTLPFEERVILTDRLNQAVQASVKTLTSFPMLDYYLSSFDECSIGHLNPKIIQSSLDKIANQLKIFLNKVPKINYKKALTKALEANPSQGISEDYDAQEHCRAVLNYQLTCPLKPSPWVEKLSLELSDYDAICKQIERKEQTCVKETNRALKEKKNRYLSDRRSKIVRLIREKSYDDARAILIHLQQSFYKDADASEQLEQLNTKIDRAEAREQKRLRAIQKARERREEARERREERAYQRERERWARKNRRYIKMCRCWKEKFSFGYGMESSARMCGASNAGLLYIICKEVKRRGYY